jgi:hypothetical protein
MIFFLPQRLKENGQVWRVKDHNACANRMSPIALAMAQASA